ncbi:Uncharacterized protein DBV15_01653 [Temnothorax longispinosus]|uniref:Uncharacterized protein n=1 Tax=Temnothorax longispinosus TaxID=300112 RepID=A0A4S2L262_9HYME|nr:Uncharacterized protein DBV15_01653 [Temnothorax longispinosus]
MGIRRFATRAQRGVGASKTREAPPWNKRIMRTRFDVFEYLISLALKPSHHPASYDSSDVCHH